MSDICKLCSLEEQQHCRVRELKTIGAMRSRLSDLGLIEGTPVTCLRRSASGDPAAYLIRGAVIAIRNSDAAEIIVEKTPL